MKPFRRGVANDQLALLREHDQLPRALDQRAAAHRFLLPFLRAIGQREADEVPAADIAIDAIQILLQRRRRADLRAQRLWSSRAESACSPPRGKARSPVLYPEEMKSRSPGSASGVAALMS